MSLSAVRMPADVYHACCLHALTFELEEVMGLIVGKFENDVAYIKTIIILQRSDKRRDRVEISTEQLHSAFMKTSELSEFLGEGVYVMGWYHSHPHITAEPSHVDIKTQLSYQSMDSRFFGLIFSVFNKNKVLGEEVQVTCFQAVNVKLCYQPYRKINIPLHIDHVPNLSIPPLDSILTLPQILSQEDITNYDEAKKNSHGVFLAQLQNNAEFVDTQSQILHSVANPLILNTEIRVQANNFAIKELRKEKDELLKKLTEQDEQNKPK